MAEGKIRERSFEFSLRLMRLVRAIQEDRVGRILVGQLLRSGTSIGANVEEAQAAQSRADFISKMSIALKEARETLYWLRLFQADHILTGPDTDSLLREADELVAILTTIVKSTKNNS